MVTVMFILVFSIFSSIFSVYIFIHVLDKEDDKIVVFCIISSVTCLLNIVFILLFIAHGLDACLILSDHIDNNKTRIIEENGEAKELYIIVDGKEYHFEFEEE